MRRCRDTGSDATCIGQRGGVSGAPEECEEPKLLAEAGVGAEHEGHEMLQGDLGPALGPAQALLPQGFLRRGRLLARVEVRGVADLGAEARRAQRGVDVLGEHRVVHADALKQVAPPAAVAAAKHADAEQARAAAVADVVPARDETSTLDPAAAADVAPAHVPARAAEPRPAGARMRSAGTRHRVLQPTAGTRAG